MAHPHVIDRNVAQTRTWLNELAGELRSGDQRAAYSVLRAVLHTLRDRLTVAESAQLAAQFPELIRGIYYEGWKPSGVPARYRDVDSFLRRVADEAMLSGETEASFAVEAVARVLRRHVSEGELADVLAVLPSSLRSLVAESR